MQDASKSPAPLWLFAAGASLVIFTTLAAIPGYLTWDSGTYHLMVRSLRQGSALRIINGYDELSSPLLAVGQTMVSQGKLVSQYPEYYTFIALPFYVILGYRGLLVLNSIVFVGICIIIWQISRLFNNDRNAHVVSVCIYAFATYSIEYTQSSYPHLTSTFLVCISIWLLWRAAFRNSNCDRTSSLAFNINDLNCLMVGFFFGAAIGVRLDSVFAGIALAVPFAIYPSLRWRQSLWCIAGLLPPLLGLAWINLVKFGVFFPFSYGLHDGSPASSILPYMPVAVGFVGAVGLLAWHHRRRQFYFRRRAIVVAAVAVAFALAVTPQGQRLMSGSFQLLIDLRPRPEIPEAALSRSADGAVIYWNNVKKSLLESCPYLILLIIPAVRGLIAGGYGSRWLLWLVPVGYVAVFSYLGWHGSVGWNNRYFIPILPFMALLASHEIRVVLEYVPVRPFLLCMGAAVFWMLLMGVFVWTLFAPPREEIILLDGGLVIAILLLALQIVEILVPQRAPATLGKVFGGVVVISLVWSSALAFGVDYLTSAAVQLHLLAMARQLEPEIADRALIVTYWPDALWGLLDTVKHPVIADYSRASPAQAVQLVERAVNHRPVYWMMPAVEHDFLSTSVLKKLRSENIHAHLLKSAAPYRFFEFEGASSRSSDNTGLGADAQ